jgi:hypothetical protein
MPFELTALIAAMKRSPRPIMKEAAVDWCQDVQAAPPKEVACYPFQAVHDASLFYRSAA